jgi:hypothetical protein
MTQVEVLVILRPTVSKSVRRGAGYPIGPMTRFYFSLFDNYYLSSRCSEPSPISPLNRVVQPKVKVISEIFNVAIWRAAWEACSATWNLGNDSAFALGPRKTTENFDRVGRSQNFPDAN